MVSVVYDIYLCNIYTILEQDTKIPHMDHMNSVCALDQESKHRFN